MWVEFVVGSLPFSERIFSAWVLWFSPNPQQLTFPNPNSTRNQVDEEPLCGRATCFIISCVYIYYFDIITQDIIIYDQRGS